MINYVISLKSATNRRKHIEHEFGKQKINFQFFDALTPDQAKPLAESLGLYYEQDRLTGGELACFMSHVSLWKRMVDENIPYMVVFEDDIYLGQDANKILNSDVWIPNGVDIIKLEAFSKRVIVSEKTYLEDNERVIAPLKYKNLGTAGYLLSLKSAQEYIEFVKTQPLIPLDEMMFDLFLKSNPLNIYQMLPALCIQEMNLYPEKELALQSDLILERKQRMKKFKKKGFAKVKVEIYRLVDQVKLKFFSVESIYK